MRKIAIALLFSLIALPAWAAEPAAPKPANPDEIVYRVNLGRADDVKLLLGQGNSIDATNQDGVPLLALAAQRQDKEGLNVVGALLDAGAKIDGADRSGQTPIFYAARRGNKEVVEYLLNHGASYYIADNNGDIARTIAYREGHKDIVETMDNFVKDQTEKVKKQYEDYNKSMQERTEEAQPQPPPAAEPVAEAAPAEKPDAEALKKATSELAFSNCAFQYWSFCQATKQSTELSPEELGLAVDSYKESVIQLSRDLMEKYRVNRAYIDHVSLQAKLHIFNRMSAMPSKTYRHEQGIGKLDDMNTRCNAISLHWEEKPPAIPAAANSNNSQPNNVKKGRNVKRH